MNTFEKSSPRVALYKRQSRVRNLQVNLYIRAQDRLSCLVPRLNIFPKILLMMNLSPQQESLVCDNEAFFFCLSTEKRRRVSLTPTGSLNGIRKA